MTVPMKQLVKEKPDEENQTETQILSPAESVELVLIIRNDSPNFPCVVRDEDEPLVEETVQSLVMVTPECQNASPETADYLKAVKLVNAAAYAVNNLKRGQQTDLVTLAKRRLVESPDLDKLAGNPWESKDLRELEHQFDANLRKLVTDFWYQ